MAAELRYTDSELEAYLDEGLPSAAMAAIELALRSHTELAQRLAEILHRRDQGVHSLGEIWRRHRLSCPTREELGSFLLDVLASEQMKYIRFHLDGIGCRICAANLADLKGQASAQTDTTQQRRRQYFQSSVGYLGKP